MRNDTSLFKHKNLLSRAIRLGLASTLMTQAILANADEATNHRHSIALYKGQNQSGEMLLVAEDTAFLGEREFNDHVQSVDIPAGWQVRFYEHSNHTGRYWTRNEGKHNLPDGANISSIDVLSAPDTTEWSRTHVTLFTGANQTGSKVFIAGDSSYLGDLLANDDIASFNIPQGLQVRFYEHANYTGRFWTRNEGQGNLPEADVISSVKVLEKPDLDTAVVIKPSEGRDIHLPNDIKNIRVEMADGQWAKYTHLPEGAKIGTTVNIVRYSTWATYVALPGGDVMVPINGQSTFIWDGRDWNHTATQTAYSTRISNQGLYDVRMNNTQPSSVETVYTIISGVASLAKPDIVNLKDITIENGKVYNKTPYTLDGIYVERQGTLYYLEFANAIPEYSSASLASGWSDANYVHMTRLGNNQFNFSPSLAGGRPEARWANAEERDSTERVQMYERYWLNAPGTLSDITARVVEQCDTNGGYSECKGYRESTLDYAADMYFAQSVSGLTTNFLVDPSVWGLASAPGKNLIKSTTSGVYNVWMSPNLMGNMLSSNQATSIDAEQGLVHEYFHNLGFSHESGWASNTGIDDLFGAVAQNYRAELGDRYHTSNLVVKVEKNASLSYTFSTHARSEVTDLKMRLLSTETINGEIVESGTNRVTITFDEIPATDVHVSFYSGESRQMATVALSEFVGYVSGQGELNNLTNNFAELVNKYAKVYIKTANGSWVRDFYLPEGKEGSVLVFQSDAGWSSTIHYDGRQDGLYTGNRIEYHYTGGRWVRQ